MTSPLAELRERLPELMLRDQRRLQRRIDGVRKVRDPAQRRELAERIAAEADAAQQRIEQRRASVPTIRYPPELPVSQRRAELAEVIRDHQVVIVAGETGSGKTTQLPKICLELGRGVRGMIGHTQPRRLAARTVAERIASELDTPVGDVVGWKVRFTDRVGDDTLVKIMTDGILLAEIGQDRQLGQYDTLIIDEAHERSLNIDFILGYLKQLLPRRPDLKVIITSATIDPDRFAEHFAGAPIVEVSGRTYPVEVRYRSHGVEDDRDQIEAICDAVDELRIEGPGDVLVFLSGEREIRDTADALTASLAGGRDSIEILPLYARLSAADQHRVFGPHRGRRIVLATNVAETSLTVPGIKYVVDPGTARISRYSHRLKVQRLPIEAISQASANQRAGRCGRTSDGICIRLYAEDDFVARPEFTEPEILRTNLAAVILQMISLGLGEVADFPFLDPPDRRAITDGMALLHELAAIDPAAKDPRKRLTPLGRTIAQLPVDPRLARMIVEADRNSCVHEVLVVAAALSIQDPRERPLEAQQAADQAHARFADKTSDFLSYLNLWRYLQEQQDALSSSRFRALCRAEYLHHLRVREWQDLYGQLRQVARGLGMSIKAGGEIDQQRVHTSLLAGLLSHIGFSDGADRDYLGARGARFNVFPGSALFRKPPRWLMAAELVETSRLWARGCARIEPEWVEPLAGHLVKRSYSEPHWERKRGSVVGYERVTLYGLPVVTSRKVDYGRIDPELSRELFIRHALVEGDWETRHEFFHANSALREDVEELEHRARRRDILVDDQTLFDFYDRRVGAEVVSARHFDTWWRTTRRTEPELLTFSPELLVNPDAAADVGQSSYPSTWQDGALRFDLSYEFDPGAEADGVTVHIPLAVLNQVSEWDGFDWQVPGLRAELVTALIRSLPKPLRRELGPAPNVVAAVLDNITPADGPLLEVLERELGLPPGSWQLDRVPDHLRMTFQVIGEDGRPLAHGKDLGNLKAALVGRIRETLSATGDGLQRHGLRSWVFGALPETHRSQRGGQPVTAYPALVDEGDSVGVRLLATEAEQRHEMWLGTRRLLRLTVPSPIRQIQSSLTNQAKLTLSRNPHGGVAALLEDCLACALDSLIAAHGGPAWDEASFDTLRDAVRVELATGVLEVLGSAERILGVWSDVRSQLATVRTSPASAPAVADMAQQLDELVRPGFLADAGRARLPDVLRYLRAIGRRLEKLPENPARDRMRMIEVAAVRQAYEQAVAEVPSGRPPPAELCEVRWMIEELRVSHFAQSLGTAYPVSEKRIYRVLDHVAY